MSFKYGKRSLEKLNTCHKDLIDVFKLALDMGLIDISIIEGVRSKEDQNEYYNIGKSKVRWPNGKHNVSKDGQKSMAVDAAPFVNGKASLKKEHCIYLAGIVMACAKVLEVNIRWGGNWDCDAEPITDQDFQDLVHFEIGGKYGV